jgi:hypothetical protein
LYQYISSVFQFAILGSNKIIKLHRHNCTALVEAMLGFDIGFVTPQIVDDSAPTSHTSMEGASQASSKGRYSYKLHTYLMGLDQDQTPELHEDYCSLFKPFSKIEQCPHQSSDWLCLKRLTEYSSMTVPSAGPRHYMRCQCMGWWYLLTHIQGEEAVDMTPLKMVE